MNKLTEKELLVLRKIQIVKKMSVGELLFYFHQTFGLTPDMFWICLSKVANK